LQNYKYTHNKYTHNKYTHNKYTHNKYTHNNKPHRLLHLLQMWLFLGVGIIQSLGWLGCQEKKAALVSSPNSADSANVLQGAGIECIHEI
jgi:hypothetical protein